MIPGMSLSLTSRYVKPEPGSTTAASLDVSVVISVVSVVISIVSVISDVASVSCVVSPANGVVGLAIIAAGVVFVVLVSDVVLSGGDSIVVGISDDSVVVVSV